MSDFKTLLRLTALLLILLFTVANAAPAQTADTISAVRLSRDVRILASDSLKGRKPGTPEMEVAAGYIRDQFHKAGLQLLLDSGYQQMEIVTDIEPGDKNLFHWDTLPEVFRKSFIPLSFSSNGILSSQIVFAGYGFDIDTDSLKWNDYRGLDVNGKWVMVLRGDPELDNPDSRFISLSDMRSKVLTAKDHQAGGLLVVTPPGYEKEDKLISLTTENNDVTGGILCVNITRELADRMLRPSGVTIDSLERQMVRFKKPAGFTTGIKLTAAVDLIRKKASTVNVVALLKGSDPALNDEYLVVGAHYDHLGMGGPGSGSRTPDTLAVHNGADDNASGTAMVLELARVIGKSVQEPRRSILFVAFTGEEMGLIGSKYFVNHPPVDLKKITAMFNFDMVGRFDPSKNAISVSGTGTAAEADSLLLRSEEGLSFKVTHSPDGYGPSDHAAFYSADIPVLYFTTGVHTDYHTPADDADKLDIQSEQKIGRWVLDLIHRVDLMPQQLTFRESGKKESSGRGGRKLKVTLGIMPDFAGTEKKGLRVDGITKDGPADKGGLHKGDIITGINGLPVGNIYEYMSRLQKLKQGMTISVEIIRNEKEQVLLVQL